jgi:DNA primase
MLLSQCAVWDQLGAEEHAMLCALPAPHGPLFAWLESQLHEHGPQPWAALREGLREHENEALATKLMAGAESVGLTEPGTEAPQELRNLLNRMLIEQLKLQETEAITAATADPTALERYRALQVRRLALEATLAPGV